MAKSNASPKAPETILGSWLFATVPPLLLVACAWVLATDVTHVDAARIQPGEDLLHVNPWITEATIAVSEQSPWVLPIILALMAALYALVFVLRDVEPRHRGRVESWGFRLGQLSSLWAGIAVFAGFGDRTETRPASLAFAGVVVAICLILSIFAAELSYFSVGLPRRRREIDRYLVFLDSQLIQSRRRRTWGVLLVVAVWLLAPTAALALGLIVLVGPDAYELWLPFFLLIGVPLGLFYLLGVAVASIGITDFPRSMRRGYRWVWAIIGACIAGWLPVQMGVRALVDDEVSADLLFQLRGLGVLFLLVTLVQSCAFYPVPDREAGPTGEPPQRWEWRLEPALRYLLDLSTKRRMSRLQRIRASLNDEADGLDISENRPTDCSQESLRTPIASLGWKSRALGGAAVLIAVSAAVICRGPRRDPRAGEVERL